MIRKLILVLMIFLAIPMVLAVDTPITVKTLPNHVIDIYVLNPAGSWTRIESFLARNSGPTGEVSVISTKASVLIIDVAVVVKEDKKKITSERFKGYDIGQAIEIYVLRDESEGGGVVKETNVTLNETEEAEVVEEEETKTGITGSVISGVRENKSKILKVVYIVVGVILLGFMVFLVVGRIRRRKFDSGNIKIVSMKDKIRQMKESKKKEAREEMGSGRAGSLEEAQKRLKEAQEEVVRFQRMDKAEELEMQIERLKGEVDKLKDG